MITYIHGYGASPMPGKAQCLKDAGFDVRVPRFDYDGASPSVIFQQVREAIEVPGNELVVASSMGGYFTLSVASDKVPVLLINPATDIRNVFEKVVLPRFSQDEAMLKFAKDRYEAYLDFDSQYFRNAKVPAGYHCFLSTDDELLGTNTTFQQQFPDIDVHWFDRAGHGFARFSEQLPLVLSFCK